jgi:hypothetical protein
MIFTNICEEIRRALNTLKDTFLAVDSFFSLKLSKFFLSKGYFSEKVTPQIASQIPTMIRVVFYLAILLLFMIPLKLFFPESRLRSLITYSVLTLIVLGIFGVFLGFFELMYNF